MGRVFLDILIVLVAAKLAAEGAERLSVPPVVGEILAGIVIGPSVLGLVHRADHGNADVLPVLGEIGVILLLLEVGMQMDLRELRAVGRSSMLVAIVGVALPFATGFLIAEVFGLTSNQALFTSAALTATSVGITARVFGDLRALASVEARTVLGAAVADDVIGLVILTIVVRIVTGDGQVTVASVGSVIGIAVLFLVATTVVGTLGAPRLFAGIERLSRSSGTLFALALAFTLGFAELASASKLAPIVGAFVAGLSLGRSSAAQRIQRELTPVGHLFIPVFFLQIGIDTDVTQFAKPAVLGLAGGLIVVAVLGKVAAGLGAIGSPGNKLLIGLGMIPRGEVGLIFAGIGLREGVLGENSYAAILLMVLVTTLVTPPLLTWQLRRVQRRTPIAPEPEDVEEPTTGWLRVAEVDGRRSVTLAARPPRRALLTVALEAAVLVEEHDPSRPLLDALSDGGATDPIRWDERSTVALVELLRSGGVRSWRFLESIGILERALPEIGDALRRRRNDSAILDPVHMLRWPTLERALVLLGEGPLDDAGERTARIEAHSLAHPERVLLAALLVDVIGTEPHPERLATAILERLALVPDDRRAVATLVAESELLRAAAVRSDGLREDSVLRLALHLGDAETARALYVLSVAIDALEPWESAVLDELFRLVVHSIGTPGFGAPDAPSRLDRTRDEATALVAHRHLADRIAAAPVSYLLREEPTAIARHVALIEPIPSKGRFRVGVHNEGADLWRVEVGGRDRLGLLAMVTGVLEEARLDVVDAVIATWGDGGALQAFRVRTDTIGIAPDALGIERAIERAVDLPLHAAPVSDAVVAFDDVASPWHTIAEVRATDRRGLLHALSVAFAASGADVHSARITTEEAMAFDVFDLTDRQGHKLGAETKALIRTALVDGVDATTRSTRNPFRRSNTLGTRR